MTNNGCRCMRYKCHPFIWATHLAQTNLCHCVLSGMHKNCTWRNLTRKYFIQRGWTKLVEIGFEWKKTRLYKYWIWLDKTNKKKFDKTLFDKTCLFRQALLFKIMFVYMSTWSYFAPLLVVPYNTIGKPVGATVNIPFSDTAT